MSELLEKALDEVRTYLEARAMSTIEEDGTEADVALPDTLFNYHQLAPEALDNYFRRLSVIPYEGDSFLVRGPSGQTLGRWPNAAFCEVMTLLMEFNRICPGGAAYVMLNDELTIRQWELNKQHFHAKAMGQRRDQLPARGSGDKAKMTAQVDLSQIKL